MSRLKTVNGGEVLFCCWDDCNAAAREGNDQAVFSDGKTVTYVFCTDRHRQYWIGAYARTATYGNAPAGTRNPLGLWVPA